MNAPRLYLLETVLHLRVMGSWSVDQLQICAEPEGLIGQYSQFAGKRRLLAVLSNTR